MAPLSFSLDLRDPARRRLGVELVLRTGDLASQPANPTRTLEFFLPAWTPGSYLVREYARHLGDFGAEDAGSETLAWRKTAKNRYRVEVPDGCDELRVRYTLYAHELSVRTSDLTDRHAFLSGAAVFLWPAGLPNTTDVAVQVHIPETWEVQTSLPGSPHGLAHGSPPDSSDGSAESTRTIALTATGLDDLIDSPILAGEFETLSFDVLGKPHHFVLDGLEGLRPRDSLVPDTIKVIEQAAAIFGNAVPYDEYKFLCMFTDFGRGGLEHLASSALLAPRTTFGPKKEYQDFMGLVAHEFFHVWNVKRMRPADLWEFDYENENYTELLWVAEGFTAYYDDHLCRRAGILTTKQYLTILAGGITDLRRTPGRNRQSLSEASFDAWIRLYRPDEDARNSTLSYYGNGALAALSLDLRIRTETNGAKSLDDVVRALYARTFEQARGYTHEDIANLASEAAGTDLSSMLDSLVRKTLDPDFETMFAALGLELREKSDKPSIYLGVHFRSGTNILSSVLDGAPADLARLMPQDEILALNDLHVTPDNWNKVFDQVAIPGQPLEALIVRRGRVLTVDVVPQPRPSSGLELVVAETTTADQDRLRRAWLFED